MDQEAERLCNAKKYGRKEDRQDTRAGYYQRSLETKSGKVQLNIPKLRTLPFETAIIEQYRRRESSVEEALIEMYLAGVSVRTIPYVPVVHLSRGHNSLVSKFYFPEQTQRLKRLRTKWKLKYNLERRLLDLQRKKPILFSNMIPSNLPKEGGV